MLSNLNEPIKINRLFSVYSIFNTQLFFHFFNRVNHMFKKIKTDEFKITVHYKAENEKFTEADWIIQKMFENYMTKYFPEIKIVGEEDTSSNLIEKSEYFIVDEEVDFNKVKESDIPDSILAIDPKELCLYIDPIDSTDQFIKKNFGPVTSLIGITLNGNAFIGFIHYPLYEGKDQAVTYLNIPSKGVFMYDYDKEDMSTASINKDEGWPFISSGTRTTEEMKNRKNIILIKCLLNLKVIKPLMRMDQEINLLNVLLMIMYILHLEVNCVILFLDLGYWDVCAGHCIAKELGGGLYYLNGEEVTYPCNYTEKNVKDIVILTASGDKVKKFLEVYDNSGIKIIPRKKQIINTYYLLIR